MVHLIERGAIEHEKILVVGASMHVESGYKFGAGSYAGKILKSLHNIR